MKLAFKTTEFVVTCPACGESIEGTLNYRSEGLTTQDDGSAAVRVAVKADLAAVEAHVASHAA
jgi:hypothetical protein